MMADRISREISFASGRKQLRGYLTRPRAATPRPGVVVIHEALGLNEPIRDIARRFADAGYVALAVDLFAERNRAMCIMRLFSGMALNALQHGGIRDLRAALTFLSEEQGVDRTRLGAIGFCLGGGLAIAWACTDHRLKAIAPYYGFNPRPLGAVARACPIVGSYPGTDLTTSHGRTLDRVLDGYGIPHDIKIYPRTMHSFFNRDLPTYNAEASEDSWNRVMTFFSQHLGQSDHLAP